MPQRLPSDVDTIPMPPMNAPSQTRSSPLTLLVLAVGLFAAVLLGCRQTNGARGSPSASAEEPVLPSRVHGCWALRLERDSLHAWLPAGSLPGIVELDSVRAEDTDDARVYAAHSWFGDRRASQPFSVWRPVGADSIRVQRAGALAGIMLQLGTGDDALDGRVIVYRDVGMADASTQRTGPVTMTPTRCPDA